MLCSAVMKKAFPMSTIETKSLKLVFFTLPWMRAALNDPATLSEALGVGVPENWPDLDFAEALPFLIDDLEKEPSKAIWDGMIIHKSDGVIIGDMGLKGGPDEKGIANVGYSIIPEYRNRGYATEMLHGLITWAFQEKHMRAITAECLKDNSGSIRVLEKVGMHCLRREDDMCKWEIRREEW